MFRKWNKFDTYEIAILAIGLFGIFSLGLPWWQSGLAYIWIAVFGAFERGRGVCDV
jgi:hypothetical protein